MHLYGVLIFVCDLYVFDFRLINLNYIPMMGLPILQKINQHFKFSKQINS